MRPFLNRVASALVAVLFCLAAALAPAPEARADDSLEKIAEALSDLCAAEPANKDAHAAALARIGRAGGGGPTLEAANALVEALEADAAGDARRASLAGERVEAVAEHVEGKIMKRAVALASLIGARHERNPHTRDRLAQAALVAFGVSAETDGPDRWLELARAGEAALLLGRVEEAATSWKDAASLAPKERRREIMTALGRGLAGTGRVSEAAKAFQAALYEAAAPKGARSVVGAAGADAGEDALRRERADALDRLGDAGGALAALGPVPPDERPEAGRARLDKALGKPGAGEDPEAAVARAPLCTIARATLAERAFAKGDVPGALTHARIAFAFEPRNPARVELLQRAIEAAGPDAAEERAPIAAWRSELDAALAEARAAGIELPTATALRLAARELALGRPEAAAKLVGDPAALDAEAQLLRLRADAAAPANRSKVAKAATALMKRFGDAPELRALGGTPPPAPPAAARPGGGAPATAAPGSMPSDFSVPPPPTSGAGLAGALGALGAAILLGGAALFVLRRNPKVEHHAPQATAADHGLPATRRYEKSKMQGGAPRAGAGEAPRFGPREIVVGVVALLGIGFASYQVWDAVRPAPFVDPTIRVRAAGDPIPLYKRRTGDEVLDRIPPGTKVAMGHDFGRSSDGAPPRVTVQWAKAGAESPLQGCVDEKDLVAEDLASIRQRRADALK